MNVYLDRKNDLKHLRNQHPAIPFTKPFAQPSAKPRRRHWRHRRNQTKPSVFRSAVAATALTFLRCGQYRVMFNSSETCVNDFLQPIK